MIKHASAILVTGFFLSLSFPVQAQLIAYEPFAFSGGVPGHGSGTGWSGNWSGGSATTTTGLTYSSLATSGSAASNGQSFRNLSAAAGGANSTTWISYLGSQTSSSYMGVNLMNSSTEILEFGSVYSYGADGNPSTHYGIYRNISGFSKSHLGSTPVNVDLTGTTNLFVLQLAVNVDSSATAYLFLNPTLGSTPSTSSAIASLTWAAGTMPTFNRIRIDAPIGALDEIRIGNTFADVTPVPEPSIWGLMICTVAFFLIRFRPKTMAA